MPLISSEPMQEIYTSKRVNVKGHYRVIVRNSKGQIVSSKKWHNYKTSNMDLYCPRCRHYAMVDSGTITINDKKHGVQCCSRCNYRRILKAEDKPD